MRQVLVTSRRMCPRTCVEEVLDLLSASEPLGTLLHVNKSVLPLHVQTGCGVAVMWWGHWTHRHLRSPWVVLTRKWFLLPLLCFKYCSFFFFLRLLYWYFLKISISIRLPVLQHPSLLHPVFCVNQYKTWNIHPEPVPSCVNSYYFNFLCNLMSRWAQI